MVKFEIRQIDALNFEGEGWHWNTSYKRASLRQAQQIKKERSCMPFTKWGSCASVEEWRLLVTVICTNYKIDAQGSRCLQLFHVDSGKIRRI